MIVQLLHEAQSEHGYLRDEDLTEIARKAGVPLARVEDVAGFFPHYRREPPPKFLVQVCRDMACHLNDARGLHQALAQIPGVAVEGTSCLGRCDRAPVICVSRHGLQPIHEHIHAGRSHADLVSIVQAVTRGETPKADTDKDYPISRKGWYIDIYARRKELPPYAAVKKLFAECREALQLKADEDLPKDFKVPPPIVDKWLKKLLMSQLLGMGGAGVKAGQKWGDVYKAKGTEKHVVMNGDESEPCTFKDRELLLQTPEIVVEGIILAGLLIGATKGWIYIRHEYPEQIARIREEIKRAEGEDVCGRNIQGSNLTYPVEVFVSPGGYICGEQSALLEAMEDRRSQPRNRPPELAVNGLFDKPTCVNNVETLAWTPAIFLESDDWYFNKAAGFKQVGWRLFSICGHLNKPGVYEMAISQTLGDLIDKAGGVKGGQALGCVATSGPSGGFLPPRLPVKTDGLAGRVEAAIKTAAERDKAMGALIEDFAKRYLLGPGVKDLDIRVLPLDLNFFRNIWPMIGLKREMMLGAGLAVYAAGTDMLSQAVNAAEFFRNESCGKCVPCRIGSQKLAQIGTDFVKRSKGENVQIEPDEDIFELDSVMQLTSICGLGVVAGKPLTTWMDYFKPATAQAAPKTSGPVRFS